MDVCIHDIKFQEQAFQITICLWICWNKDTKIAYYHHRPQIARDELKRTSLFFDYMEPFRLSTIAIIITVKINRTIFSLSSKTHTQVHMNRKNMSRDPTSAKQASTSPKKKRKIQIGTKFHEINSSQWIKKNECETNARVSSTVCLFRINNIAYSD